MQYAERTAGNNHKPEIVESKIFVSITRLSKYA